MLTARSSDRCRGVRSALSILLTGAIAAVAVIAFVPQSTYAAGDPPPASPPTKPTGSKAKPKPKAKPKEKGSSLRDDQIYSLGYWQAKGGQWEPALATLRQASNQTDPRIQTMIGYALRKLGRVEEAMGYYLAALATDPQRTTTREYLGEAYLQINRPDKAREQLAEIASRRGTGCEDYQLLAEEIANFERRAG